LTDIFASINNWIGEQCNQVLLGIKHIRLEIQLISSGIDARFSVDVLLCASKNNALLFS